MRQMKLFLSVFVFTFAIAMSSCGTNLSEGPIDEFAPPSLEPCGELLESKENEDLLKNYFEYLRFHNGETGEAFDVDENGFLVLTTRDFLGIGYKSVSQNHLRVCLQELDSVGNVTFENTINTEGSGTWVLQPFDQGEYVLRIIVKNWVLQSHFLRVID